MQYAWQSGEEQMNSEGANEDSTRYDMLRMILEANLKLMELSEKLIRIYESKSEQEKDLITYSSLKGLMEFGEVMEKSFNIAKS